MKLFEAIGKGYKTFLSHLLKKDELLLPYEFALVRTNKVAKERGINDEFSREIVIFRQNKEYKVYQYSEHLVNILRKNDIPVEYEPEDTEEDIEFDEVGTFGTLIVRQNKQ